jgi:cholera toxin transcriptional activator
MDFGGVLTRVDAPDRTGDRIHCREMADLSQARRYRFGAFEADAATGELRRQGLRVKLNAQPFQVLLMLLDRPGELLTREEISRELWPGDTFVDFEHGVNSAVARIREALRDTAGNSRFVETLARRGYRFVAPVERIGGGGTAATPTLEVAARPEVGSPEPAVPVQFAALEAAPPTTNERPLLGRILASPEDLPRTSHATVRTLFLLLQMMYLAFYVGALANLAEIEDLLSVLARGREIFMVMIVTAGILIPIRAFVLCVVLFRAPRARAKFLTLWPLLLLLDVLWALSPFLLLHHIDFGLALACTALLVYSPFAQRSLVLMGAGEFDSEISSASPR